jgi:hypothetical protein
MSQKSILEQALLQVQTLEEAVKQNAKGILASTMKQELNDLLREQEEDEDETEVPVAGQSEDEVNPDEEEDVTGDEPEDDETSINDEPSDEEDEMADEPDEEGEMGDEEFGMDDMSDEMESDDDVVDMTSASDDEVLKVFKAMKPEDGIVVKKEGDKLSLSVDDQEYIIKLDGGDGGTEMGLSEEESYDESFSNPEDDAQLNALGEEDDEDGTVYEVTLDEDEIALDQEGIEEPKKVEATEAARNSITAHGNKNGMNRSGLPSKKVHKAGSGVFGINEEVETLKKQNSEYKKALVLFKEKLNEVAVFNANLAYATRLFTEHSTTKQEKLNILKRFDSISSINEAKNLYKSIKTELDTKKPMTESVVDKISLTPQTSSTEVLSESKAYENPQFRRMKDLMSKIK